MTIAQSIGGRLILATGCSSSVCSGLSYNQILNCSDVGDCSDKLTGAATAINE